MTDTYLTETQMQNILQVARAEYGPREHCFILLAAMHGLRASEIAHLKVSDIQNGHIDVRRLKDSLHTVQPLQTHPNPLLDEPSVLATWMLERGDGDGSVFLFTSRQGSALSRRQIHRLFEAIAIRAGIPAGLRNPHQCKHFLASTLSAGCQSRARPTSTRPQAYLMYGSLHAYQSARGIRESRASHERGIRMKVTAAQKIAALTRALNQVAYYRAHDDSCAYHMTETCTCGLRQAMDAAREAVKLEWEESNESDR